MVRVVVHEEGEEVLRGVDVFMAVEVFMAVDVFEVLI